MAQGSRHAALGGVTAKWVYRLKVAEPKVADPKVTVPNYGPSAPLEF